MKKKGSCKKCKLCNEYKTTNEKNEALTKIAEQLLIDQQ